MLFFLVNNNIRNARQVKLFILFMLLTCFIVSVYALRAYYISGIRATAPFEGEGGEANTLAGYLVVIMGVCLGWLIYSDSLKKRILLAGFLGFILLTSFHTQSRGGLLGLIVMYLTFLALTKRGKPILLLILFCGSIIPWSALLTRAGNQVTRSSLSRLYL